MQPSSTISPQKVLIIWGALAAAVVVAIIGGLMLAGRPIPTALPISLAVSLASFGAVPLFVVGLKSFKKSLRVAYTLICIGIILYGIGQLQFSLFELVDGTAWVNSGGVMLPYVLSIGFIFFGVRRFARLMQLRSLWASGFMAYGSAFGLAIGTALLMGSAANPLILFEVWLTTILIFSFMTTQLIRSAIAQTYRSSLTWMAASVGAFAFAGLHHILLVALGADNSAYANSAISLWPSLVGAVLFIRAGYAFTRIGETKTVTQAKASPIDVIVYIAGLASQPRAINEPLNVMREVTSDMQSADTRLTVKQEHALVEVYKLLENYLIQQERLRKFTADELRQAIRTRFQPDHSGSSFWQLFAE